MNSSPQRGSFQRKNLLRRVEEGDTTAEHAEDMIVFHNSFDRMRAEHEAKPEWKENNLEYDLRSTKWICDKAKAREEYAQNIYAALCNQDWQRNDVWPRLKNQVYSCSWRYAGGIIADMREQGDYIDWYCSGIRDQDAPDNGFVSEGTVTDEIREDFFQLGWIPVEGQD